MLRGLSLKILFILSLVFVVLGQPATTYARECVLYLQTTEIYSIAQSEPQSYRFAAYNVFNLFLRTGKYEWTENGFVKVDEKDDLKPEKPLHQVEQLAATIKEINADFMLLTEVEGPNSLDTFIENYLDNKYEGFTSPSNDIRDLRISLIVKRELDLSVELKSYEALRITNPITEVNESLFVRNLPFFIIKKRSTNEYLMAIVGIHFKSQRNRSKDENSTLKRKSEAEKAAELVNNFKNKFPGIPLFVMGDFNAHISAEEFQSIRDLNFHNPFDTHFLDPDNLGLITHSYHPEPGVTKYDTIDFALIDPNYSQGLKQAFIYRYKDKNGNVKQPPSSIKERDQNPSDHFPIVFDIDL